VETRVLNNLIAPPAGVESRVKVMASVSTLAGLQAAVRSLPKVAPGKTRVYRGQTVDYETIIPAAYRNRLDRNAVWNFYSSRIFSELIKDGPPVAAAGHDQLQVALLWLKAVAQHYASGSEYLDVTHSIESAVWFALHKGEWITERNMLGPPGPPSAHDLPAEVSWLKYTRAIEPGYLYAFDVDEWDGHSIPRKLELIDLSRAPHPFSTRRMIVQSGCLILTGNDEQYDLRRHCVEGTPLRVAFPMTGSKIVKRAVHEMFPPPDADPWYRRFLSVPMTPDIDNQGGIALKRPLPVTIYRGDNVNYNEAVAATESFLFPPLLHRALIREESSNQSSPKKWWRKISIHKEWWQKVSIFDATPVLMEAPLLSSQVSAEMDSWSHELLVRDISDSVSTYSGAGQSDGKSVSLLNVLFQFSHLDEVFWERAGVAGTSQILVRGVWITRNKDELAAVLMCQDFPGLKVEPLGPVLIRFDHKTRRLVFTPPREIADLPDPSLLKPMMKPVFIGLSILRALSPVWKPEAMPQCRINDAYVVAVIADDARLVRLCDPQGVADWFVVRNREGDPYDQAHTVTGLLKVKDPRAFADIPHSVYLKEISALLASKKA
jgi:FRG domain